MATSEVSIELGNLAEHALLVDGCGGPDDGWLGSPNQAHLSVILFLIQFKFSLWREYEVVSPRCFNSNDEMVAKTCHNQYKFKVHICDRGTEPLYFSFDPRYVGL